MLRNLTLALAVGLTTTHGVAQLVDLDPDWKESEAPPPPAFKTDALLPLDMPRHLSTRFGVDPTTLRVTSDGIVRYVVVATAPGGNTSASYEAIRCLTGEVKVYARYGTNAKWNAVPAPPWRPLNDNQPSLHALALARQGACDGRAAASSSPNAIVQRLNGQSTERYQR